MARRRRGEGAEGKMQGDGLGSLLVHCSQINLQHCKTVSALLSRSLAVEHTDICLMQEPWQHGGSVKGLSGDVDLEILNRGSRPTFVTSRCQCIMDVTICTRRLAGRCRDWRVDREDTLSDHRRIRFSIEGCAQQQQDRLRRNPRATDWDSFGRNLEERLGVGRVRPCREDRLEDEVERIHVALTESFETACPARRCRMGNKVPWWSRELDRLRSQSRRLGNRAHKSKRAEDWTRLRRVFSGGPAQRLGGITLQSGETITEPREVLEHLVRAHFPDSTIEYPGECPEVDWKRTGSGDPDWKLAARIVTLDRLQWAVDSFDMYKSPDPDWIHPALLRRGAPLLLRRLIPVFRACLALGYVPGRWREVRVVFIPKTGKCSYDNAKAYRPISLSSFLLKALDRLVDRHIKEGALRTNQICPS
ncbi:uncharacterized protein LOC135171629 [Diachasmimorpha longicaudata]|uniref:uncharacterized protein LOC135171629 n=1 Tax=Diachasmimorpha longicaudata TaxID=58733 RepID=UPI0030B8C7A0